MRQRRAVASSKAAHYYSYLIIIHWVEGNSGGYLPNREAARLISTTFADTKVNNCFSIYHISRKNSTKEYFNLRVTIQ